MALRNAIGALSGTLVLGAMLAVTGCDTDSTLETEVGTSDPQDTIVSTRIVGSVGDGPIRDARVRTFTNADEEVRRSETRSDNTADYEITVRTQGRNYPLTIVADEGTDIVTNGPPDFSLVSVVMSPSRNEIANLNPYSTLIVKTAQKSGGIRFETIAEATDTVVERYGFGLGSSLIVHPIFSPMDHTNVHVVVKASETVGEMIRRTRDAVSTGCAYGEAATWRCGDEVVNTLAADLADGWIDGWIDGEATFQSRQIAAVANVASGAVMLEALANQLRIDAFNLDARLAKAQMDSVIGIVRPEAILRTGDVTIPPEALMQTRRALHAAKRVLATRDDPDPGVPHVLEAIYAVQTTPPGSTQLNPLLSDEERALEWAIDALNRAIVYAADITDDNLLDEINHIASTEDVPYLENPAEPAPDSDEGEGKEQPIDYDPNTAPVIAGTPTTALVVGQEWHFTPDAHDDDGDPLTFSQQGMPGWADFDTKTGTMWGTPDQAGTHEVTITVSDEMDSASLEFVLEVAEPETQPAAPTLGTATLAWSRPDTRADGTPLEALSGYRIYFGTDANKLTRELDIRDGEQTQLLVEDLESGTWYFAITALSSEGIESEKSNIGIKIIQ